MSELRIASLEMRLSAAERERDKLKRRLFDIFPVMEEARDALTALTTAQCKLHGIRLDLAERMDVVGSAEKWNAMDAARTEGK